MVERIVIDPITRIEGHLRMEIDVQDGLIQNAYSSGTAFRGLEQIMVGKDPRDAWSYMQRICGVCTHIHAIASVTAVEDALDIAVPKNAALIRDIMTAAQFVQDHVIHFYHLHALDWVDIVSALDADPAATSQLAQSISNWPKSSTGYFRDVQNKLRRLVNSGQLGIFTNGYWGHPAYQLPPEANLMATAHYLEALDWQKDIAQIHAIFGGKNPHPNYLVGGMACAINMDSFNTINMERLNLVKREIDKAIAFVEQVYIPDLLAIGSFYRDWTYGGFGNHLVFGGLGNHGGSNPQDFLFPAGAILNGNLNEVYDVDVRNPEEIQEFVDHAWFEYDQEGIGLHPWDGQTKVRYNGPYPPYDYLNVDEKYSWIKTPRWRGNPMEVGPLSRMLVAYARGRTEIRDLVDDSLERLDLGTDALFSALGRTLARGLETQYTVRKLRDFFDQLVANIVAGDSSVHNGELWEPRTWPTTATGVGFTEAPRGALGHWVKINNGALSLYQAVVPSTWNGSPVDGQGQKGPYEESLIGVPMANQDQPLELLRIIHSFDPCLACAAHIVDLDKNRRSAIKIL
ncbi:nickel-dependent hydrogenase large subunit [Desulfuribacillus alkaliarsenatis]|uniref:Hydrogenase n=1 Tax=Desulfuribacillus alkaliarsenatis TaxID=766136 RepID=A0A1E5G0G9_9FIRM|nr:nickel-dependent hydrogenase large subunit [Desulfuribacillus alkaliarsenatis]OEF96280.1 hydrogenase [Desulfuribacillus alkaliarsenatis]